MNSPALKLLGISFAVFLLAAAAAGSFIYRQEIRGRELKGFMESLRSWDDLDRASAGLGAAAGLPAASAPERLKALLLEGEGDTIDFLAYVDELGRQVGVSIETSDLKASKTAEAGFDDITAAFSIQGRAAGVERMIALLEALPYDAGIDSLSLTRRGGAAEAVVTLRIGILE